MLKKIFTELYSLLKDIYLFTSYSHKVPISQTFNKLPYQNLRIIIDNYLTNKYQKKYINKISNEKKIVFQKGNTDGIILNEKFFSNEKIENLKTICNDIISNYKEHNLSVDDGGNLEKNSNSFSKYYYLPSIKDKLSSNVSKLYQDLYSKEDLISQLRFLTGINFKKKDISVHISKVKGKLLSDDWHSDCFGHTAKSFLYLENVEKNNSPFCFLKKSHANKELKILNQKENSKYILKENKNKIMSGDEIWNKLKSSKYETEFFNSSEPIECVSSKGTLISCDTSGFHKKGYSDGLEERYMIGFITKRDSMFEKFKSAFF